MLTIALLLFIAGEMGTFNSLIKLPAPDTIGRVTVEKAFLWRRSVRSYADKALSLQEIGQLLWAAQGKTGKSYGRTAPSAGATYPMELYLVAGKVTGLDSGVYRYLPEEHALEFVKSGDWRQELASAALGQSCINYAPAVLVLCAEYERTTSRYGERGKRYVHIEAGHIGQNVHLQCEALGMGTVMVGAFDDRAVQQVLVTRFAPLYIMPFGYKKKQ
ncbi:SagB/ThcOx family dehydrogenase [candidate division WOR-3 bacterium]|nr:SagB/ThcOx family dehydrogenase [candidate division WOR-3 bacterium]